MVSDGLKIGKGVLGEAGPLLKIKGKSGTAAVIYDAALDASYTETLKASLENAGYRTAFYAQQGGESCKTLENYAKILNFLAEEKLSRTDTLIAMGGGTVGDLAGFAAATYLRGIDLVQIPTTLLSAVDSSIGGKTGIDLPAGKNLAGAFHQPILILCDPEILEKLPGSVLKDGMGEVIKYGMLGSRSLFEMLEQKDIKSCMPYVLTRCTAMKLSFVAEDEFDRGERRKLNLGHSFGHAVEACSGFTLSHGEAVGIGMVLITRAAVRRGICSAEVLRRLTALLEKFGLPAGTDISPEALYEKALSDKKFAEGKIHLIVPEDIGKVRIIPVDKDEMKLWLKDGLEET